MVDLLFDWFGISCVTTDNCCLYLQNRLIQINQTGGQWYSDTSPFSIPWFILPEHQEQKCFCDIDTRVKFRPAELAEIKKITFAHILCYNLNFANANIASKSKYKSLW